MPETVLCWIDLYTGVLQCFELIITHQTESTAPPGTLDSVDTLQRACEELISVNI